MVIAQNMSFTLPHIFCFFRFKTLLISSLFFVSICLQAQLLDIKSKERQGNDSLATIFNQKYSSNKLKAIQVAKQKGWSLIKNYANGRSITLEGIDSLGSPIYYTTHNIEAAIGTHTNELQKGGGLGLDLSGGTPEMEGKLGIWDGGQARLSHVEFGGRIKQIDGSSTLSDHTTHLSGTMAASGVNPQIRGMAYKAKLSVWTYSDDLAEMAQAARNMLVSNHAYGPVAGWYNNPDRPGNDPNKKWEWWGTPSINATEDYRFGFYDDKTRDLDKLAYNSPFYLIVKSADNKRTETGPENGVAYFLKNTNQTSTLARSKNDGYDVIPVDANAKNILTVGAADASFNNSQITGFKVANFSGWGPTDDGRIKPDLLGIGTNVVSSVASSNSAYSTFSGTSMASANVSGSLFLLQELYYQQNKSFMRAATLKALALHTADKPNGQNRPTYEYGWGLLNAEKASKVLMNTDKSHVVLEQTLRSNETVMQKVIGAGNNLPLVATICWTDPEATPTAISSKFVNSRTPKLINDLDIRITDESNVDVVWQPWVLDPEKPTNSATTGDNIRDNVEQVFIPQSVAGKVYTITIQHKNNLLNNNQPFSLIVSGVAPQNCDVAVKLISGNDTTLCGAGRMKIKILGGSALKYEWIKDGSSLIVNESSSLEVAKEGIYSVRAVGYQCEASSKSIVVQTANLTANVTPNGAITVCTSNPTPLQTEVGNGYKYQWYKDGQMIANANESLFYAQDAGKYSVAIKNNVCTAISASTLLISIAQKPSISTNTGTVLPPNGSIYLTTINNENLKYKWLLDNKAIPTATASRLVATKAGSYEVEITKDGCTLRSKALMLTTDTPNQILNLLDSVFIDKKNMKLFPNPSPDYLNVLYQSDNSYDLNAAIVDERGVEYQQKPLNDNGSAFTATFDLANMPVGRYLIIISDKRKKIARPFVKY